MSERMGIDRQRELGLRRLQNPNTGYNFVPAEPARPAMQIMPAHETHMQVSHPATQEVIVTTNAVDRSKGFQLMITPIALVLAVLAVLVSLAFDSDLLSFVSILVFWTTFAVVYVLGWVFTALNTPEAVSFYGAKQQWDVIKAEQRERWEHYKWQTGREASEPARPWWVEYKPLIVGLVIGWFALVAVVMLSIALGGGE